MPRIAIIGSGLIGRAWTMVFARAGWDVAMYDAVEGVAGKALGLVAEGLDELAKHGLVDGPERVRGARARRKKRRRCARWRKLRAGERARDRRGKARDLRRDWTRWPRPTRSSRRRPPRSSRAFSPKVSKGRARCLVAHPVNPPHLVPIVELVGAPWTAPETIARAKQVYESIKQVPIVVRREIEGFILNRLQGALLAEAFRLVGEGYVSPQDLDKTIKDGLGLRWSFMGPFATIELNAPGGIADYCARYTGFYKRLQAKPAGVEVFEDANIANILREWGKQATPERTRRTHALARPAACGAGGA